MVLLNLAELHGKFRTLIFYFPSMMEACINIGSFKHIRQKHDLLRTYKNLVKQKKKMKLLI